MVQRIAGLDAALADQPRLDVAPCSSAVQAWLEAEM
jgi:hypothetical protein